MTTATVPIAVTCPDWCTVSAEHHAADLWNMGGVCIHHSPEVLVHDPTGYQEAGDDAPQPFSPVEVSFTTMARPEDGREVATPIFYVLHQEMSLEQALALNDAINRAVESYRSTGGKA